MKLVRLIGVLALSALAVTVASAQATGGLKIRVVDNADKSAVIGAAVTLSNTNKLVATATIITDVNGTALFPVLRAGSGYVVTVIMDGYAGIRQETSVAIGSTKDVAIALAPEHVERVVVTAERQAVDIDQNQTSTKFSSDFIADLPVAGRFYQNVLALAPGVTDPDGDGNPNVNGARERDFKTTVGGISNVDPLTGTFLNLVASDSIEDLTVITAGAGVEFGRAQGGFAQIIQKQGSNNLEGVFGMLYSSRLLDGNGATNISSDLLPDFHLYQPSLQVSGPIVSDHLWYRLSAEAIRREDAVVLASGGNVDTVGTKRNSYDAQLTWQVSNRNKIAFNFRADPLKLSNVGISAVVPKSSTESQKFGGPSYTMTWTAPYSPTLLVDTTVAYQDTKQSFFPTEENVDNSCVPSTSFLHASQCFLVQQGVTSGSAGRHWADSRQRFTVKSDATFYKGRLWGAIHQFKAGMVIENERYFRSLDQAPTFLKFETFGQGSSKTVYNINASVDPSSTQRAVGTTWGVYGEDVIRPISNLSIQLGVRIEQEGVSAPGFRPLDPQADSDAFFDVVNSFDPPLTTSQKVTLLQNSFAAYEDPIGAKNSVQDQFHGGVILLPGSYTAQLLRWNRYRQADDINIHNTNIAPRLSIGWDPWNDGKTKFSISAGRFFDKIFLAVITTESEPVNANFSADAVAQYAAFDPTFSYTQVDRNLKTPYNDEYSFKAERTLWQESSISLTYIHRSFKRQLQDVNVNQVPGDYGRCLAPQTAGAPTLQDSWGTGIVYDANTLLPYLDTVEGVGDGLLDDCTGEQIIQPDPGGNGGGLLAPSAVGFVSRPDGVADFYVLNPGWGDIQQIGNYNASVYDGITLEFVRRQYKNWQMEASYTWSKATGDAEDFNVALGNDRSTLQDEKGFLSFDRRHSVKVNATRVLPGGIRLGGTVRWESGLPYSLLRRNFATSNSLPVYDGFFQSFQSQRTRYLTRQRNDQRNPSAWNFDAKIVKELNLAGRVNLQLTAEVFNLFNEDTYSVYNRFTKTGEQINGTNVGTRRFGRQYQLGMRLAF